MNRWVTSDHQLVVEGELLNLIFNQNIKWHYYRIMVFVVQSLLQSRWWSWKYYFRSISATDGSTLIFPCAPLFVEISDKLFVKPVILLHYIVTRNTRETHARRRFRSTKGHANEWMIIRWIWKVVVWSSTQKNIQKLTRCGQAWENIVIL